MALVGGLMELGRAASDGLILLRLERQVLHAFRRIRDFPDVRPGLLVVRQDQLIGAGVDDVALHAGRESEQHESLALSGARRRVDHRLGRAALVINLDEVAVLHAEFAHVVRAHLDERIGPAVHHEFALLVQEGVLPDLVGAPVVDEVLVVFLLLLLARRLQAAPLRFHEGRLAVLGPELAVGIKTLGADDLAVQDGDITNSRVASERGRQRERRVAQMPVTPDLLLLTPDCE